MIDINTIQELLTTAAWLTPVITGFAQALKMGFKVESDHMPILSIFLGTVLGFVVIDPFAVGILTGAILGLTASGLYDLGKKTSALAGK